MLRFLIISIRCEDLLTLYVTLDVVDRQECLLGKSINLELLVFSKTKEEERKRERVKMLL